ncbi:hypothetical protein SOCE26_058390 [Sorangium cellulosum]|uniref:Uncharacterized protein n=1 Tax=Sorangium cellulosum TaxID=56 RepID=A0A2L0EYN5_SORCE|nr:hypothetical protein [Sorangium cellulosum]AUX44375.1 hypothetical protein SOCE26_058390 [Sorangium cellulosum]
MGHRLWLLVSRYHLDAGMSSLLVYVVATAGLLAIAAIALRLSLRQRRAAARAEASFKGDAALAPGEAVVVGTVELAQGADVAVRVEIEQHGTESESSGVWSHLWSETGRRVRVHPFYLRHASGVLVRVEPGEDVALVDALDGMIRVDPTRRVRVAEIMPGEKVFALGELRRAPDPEAPAQGYRERSLGYVLVPPRGRGMLVSSEPLGERFARRAAFHRRWAVAAVVASLAFNAVFAGFHARRWLGETVDVHVTQLREDDSDDDHPRFEVTMRAADGVVFSDEVPHATFGQLRGVERLTARYVPSWPSASAVGPDATAHSVAYVALPLLGAIALAYAIRAHATKPWYEKKLLEQGSGRLTGGGSAAGKAAKRPEGRRQKPASG